MCHLIGVPLYTFLYIEGEWCALSQKKVFYSNTKVFHFFVSIIPVKDWTHVKIYMIPFVLKWWRAKRHLIHLVCPSWKYSTVFIWVQLIKCNVNWACIHAPFSVPFMKILHFWIYLGQSIKFNVNWACIHAPFGVPFMKKRHFCIYFGATNKIQC